MSKDIPILSWQAGGAVLLGCVAGTLADVDKQGSTMAKVLFPVSALLKLLHVKHRALTHSLIFVLILTLATAALPPLYHQVLIAAYFSHPLIDMFNEKGVQLWWPLRFHVRVLPKFAAIDTGSWLETLFQWILLGLSIWIPFHALFEEFSTSFTIFALC
ncbi:metal-dependent hydrolase [Paenibacillus hexagrammi]|uniref:Metal-dependent hydrolase n=1 Tax=Paenibacillus hexagrammi TaxID=2908839 RepID=A0ABY3SBI3_9BACL|nr:metal-dependent hydrolase [Paenibacillus sp. YPD9-1]UJF31338.1 metal-dependent hydrolase [Paenibacillus sp. YPD9-1]